MADMTPPTSENGADSAVTLQAGDSDSISLPEGFDLSTAEFETNGDDLIITAEDGSEVVIEGFNAGDTPPELTSPDGTQISGEMISQLAEGAADTASDTAPEAPAGGADTADADTGEGGAEMIAGTDGAVLN